MKLATFTHAGWTRIGVVDEGDMVDLAAAVPDLPQEMCAFLRAGRPALRTALVRAPRCVCHCSRRTSSRNRRYDRGICRGTTRSAGMRRSS